MKKNDQSQFIKGMIWVFVIIVALALVLNYLIKLCYGAYWNASEWASFLGSYIGGGATLIALVITIRANNNSIMEQRIYETSIRRETVRTSIKPYITTDFRFFDEKEDTNNNLIVIYSNGYWDYSYSLSNKERELIKKYNVPSDKQHIYIHYELKNIGAGSAINGIFQVNENECISQSLSLSKDEIKSIYFMITLDNPDKGMVLNIYYHYYDVEEIGHYEIDDGIEIFVESERLQARWKKQSSQQTFQQDQDPFAEYPI